jgi:AcrR family transcriptional regulator
MRAPALGAAVRRRDAQRSRARLLAAATELFAARGYAGTALRAVAQQAGVDAALIARYYGGKDGLYRAVLAADPVVAVRSDAPPAVPEPTADGAGGAGPDNGKDTVGGSPQVTDAGRRDGAESAHDARNPLDDLLRGFVERWGAGPASTVSQNVFRGDLDDAVRMATAGRVAEKVLTVLRSVQGPAASGLAAAEPPAQVPSISVDDAPAGAAVAAELRVELAAMMLLGIGVARTAGTLPALAAADPEHLGALVRELLDAALD